MDICSMTALELGEKIRHRELSAVEAVRAYLARTEAAEPEINSFVTVDAEGALKRAQEVQKGIDEGIFSGPLAGVPVAVKDNLCTKGLLTTCSSKILSGFKPTFSAQAVRNLEKEGAIIIGKTNMDEFAMGSTTETSYYGVTRNPWNTTPTMFPAVLPAVPARRWRQRNVRLHWAQIPAARFVSQVPFAEW